MATFAKRNAAKLARKGSSNYNEPDIQTMLLARATVILVRKMECLRLGPVVKKLELREVGGL